MTVLARWIGGLRGPGVVKRARWSASRSGFVAIAAIAASADPASAQLAGSVTVQSDYRFRGYSLSGEHPVAKAALSYDHPSGVYANASAISELAGDGPELLGVIGNVGYAARLNPSVSLDAGIVHADYDAGGYGAYTELYLGAAARGVAAYVHYSPDYFGSGTSTIYAEAKAVIEPAPRWNLSGHVGALSYLGASSYNGPSDRYDWQLSASRQLGVFEGFAALSGGGGGRQHDYPRQLRTGTAIVFGITAAF